MTVEASAAATRGPAPLLGWKRVRFALITSIAAALPFTFGWTSGIASLMVRAAILGMIGVLAFGLFERWPARPPRRLARWVMQVVGVALAMPAATFVIYVASTPSGAPPFWRVPGRLEGFATLSILGVLVAPWAALAALVRQKEALARHQALEFDLERSEFERAALDARLRLLRAQVAPHFLFNTLANVQALVDAGSPQASAVLRSLTAYLRAAMPHLDRATTTMAQEVQLARAYLELMHTRMPDRLRFQVHAEQEMLTVPCPPLTLLTIVENAVRHGIDPSEEGGEIAVRVERRGSRCVLQVTDTGVGLRSLGAEGTGLSTLRERLALAFGGDAELTLAGREPHGACVEILLPTGAAS